LLVFEANDYIRLGVADGTTRTLDNLVAYLEG